MRVHRLDRIVWSFRPNAAAFLNGITSNTPDAPRNAFLNVHGRIVATFDQARISDDESWVVIEPAFAGALAAHLEKFLKIAKTRTEIVGRAVYFDLDGDAPLGPHDVAIPQKAGRLVITADTLTPNVSVEDFTLFRLYHAIPVQGIDYRDEFVLNVDEDTFVSYSKGCFLGQEPVSKVHNRSRPTWRLAVRTEDECDDSQRGKMTSRMCDPRTGRIIGFVFVENKG